MPFVPPRFVPPSAPATEGKPAYVFSDRVKLAIDVALASGRPLLVSGSPGSGKTTLARAVAAGLGWRFLGRTITSRTRLEDLEAEIDMLRRLADAQANDLDEDWTYLKPGVLWWAFDRPGALRRGADGADTLKTKKAPPPALADPSEGVKDSEHVVILLDEIDKADPDLPNDLLEPLDRKRFSLPLPDRPLVEAVDDVGVLLMMTTNGERELPPAFLRRCITLDLPDARPAGAEGQAEGEITLEQIAAAHFGAASALAPLYGAVAQEVGAQREDAARRGLRPPSTAEYVDTLRVLQQIPELREKEKIWEEVKALLLQKTSRAPA